ncbi:hypothetical protein [Aeoliella sp.]|uniref:hypothetical protein n=1 Tax=Aeoliella sp. TaxID=2795800 RepID=UPI003CCB794E
MQTQIERLIEFWPFDGPVSMFQVATYIIKHRNRIENIGAGLIDFGCPKHLTIYQHVTHLLMESKRYQFDGYTIRRTSEGNWQRERAY